MERQGCRHGIEVLEEQDTDIVLCNHMIYSCGERLSLCDDKGSKFLLCENSREVTVLFQDR